MVISAKEIPARRRTTIKNGRTTHTRVWMVLTDNPADGTAVAALAPGVPRYGSTLNGDINTVVTSVEANAVQNSMTAFEVTVEWDAAGFENINLHPLMRPADFNYGANDYTESWFLDESKPTRKPYATSAHEPFETLPERNKGEFVINMQRNEPTFNVLLLDELAWTTNDGIVFLDAQGYAPDTLLMATPTASKVTEDWFGQQVIYYRVAYAFRARRKGWLTKVEDRGTKQLVQRTVQVDGLPTLVFEQIDILSAQNQKVTKPWPLNGEGKALASADAKPAELEFRPQGQASWASLLLS